MDYNAHNLSFVIISQLTCITGCNIYLYAPKKNGLAYEILYIYIYLSYAGYSLIIPTNHMNFKSNMKNEDILLSCSGYSRFLKLLKSNCVPVRKPISKYDHCTHPQKWIPPPCFTSPQARVKKPFRRARSFPDICYSSSLDEMEKQKSSGGKSKMTQRKTPAATSAEREDEIGEKLSQLKRERELLKEAQLMVELGESLSPSVRALVHKWRNFFTESQTRDVPSLALKSTGKAEKRHLSKRAERMLRDLEKSFRQAKEEEERLEVELGNLRRETKKARGSKKPSVKMKRLSSSHDYKYLAMKRKYEDLRQYLMQIELETRELRKENDVLHSALKEQDVFAMKEKIDYLEQEIVSRDAYIKECEEQVRNSCNVHEEKTCRLKSLVEDLQRKVEEAQQKNGHQEKEEKKGEQEFEEEWLEKLNHTKAIYEKAIQGYKEELNTAQIMREALEKRLEGLLKYYEEREERLASDYESRMKTLRLEGFTEELPPEEKDSKEGKIADSQKKEISIVKLEKIIYEREKEIEELKRALTTPSDKNSSRDEFQKQILSKLEELLQKCSEASADAATIPPSITETLKICFEEMKRRDEEKNKESILFFRKENENLRETLRSKMSELSSMKKDLDETKKKAEILTSKCEFHESKAHQGIDVGQNLGALRDLPRLQESQSQLSTLQEKYQNCLTENKVLQERLKSHTSELDAKHERIADLERRVREIGSTSRKWEREAESLEAKVDLLHSQVEKKNAILEKNSTQLEERIREYTTIAAQLERLREDHSREMAALKALNRDSQAESKLRDLEAQNAQLEAQLSVLKAEKLNCEKACKKHVKSLEEQVTRLNIRNTTLQKHMETIQATYKSMFAMEDSIWPRSLVDLPPHMNPLFDTHDPAE